MSMASSRAKILLLRTGTVLVSSAAAGVILFIAYHFLHGFKAPATFGMILTVLVVAIRWGMPEALSVAITAAIGYGVWFEAPVGYFKIYTVDGWVTTTGLLLTAVIVGQLSATSRKRAQVALARQRETENLYQLSQALLACDRSETVVDTAINEIARIFGLQAVAFCVNINGEIHTTGNAAERIPRDRLLDCGRAPELQVERMGEVAQLPVRIGEEPYGSLAVYGAMVTDTVMMSISSLVAAVIERVRAAESLATANRASELLLLNILPAEVADELRSKGMVAPKYFEDVTIMFTDFVGFTQSTEELAAEEVVTLLHEYFTAFDQISARYNLEKMKTIGDSYMCISGMPQRRPSHPVDIVMAAFEMVHEVERRAAEGRLAPWQIRIGIHTGSVIAGVVGISKFAFDIWGESVNFSSRMESAGMANRINLSGRTYSRVKDFIDCEYRGKVFTKDKREVDMYFANGVLPALLDGTGIVPPPAYARRYTAYFQKDPPGFPEFLLKMPASSG